jgi:hypothetical protein
MYIFFHFVNLQQAKTSDFTSFVRNFNKIFNRFYNIQRFFTVLSILNAKKMFFRQFCPLFGSDFRFVLWDFLPENDALELKK